MVRQNVIAVIDGAAGSCGKGKVIGELATSKDIKINASVTNCMPNAGHTYVAEDGKKYVFRNIPVAAVNKDAYLFIGPGSAIDMDTFIEEYESLKSIIGDRKIYVHELVPVIEQKHIDFEKEHIKSGSTFKGCGASLKDKILRDPELKFFKGYKNAISISNEDWLDLLYCIMDRDEGYVLLEIAQGCDLSLNFSGNHPYVTSRNVSTAQMISDSGISPSRLYGTVMVIRPFPIRISNITRDGKYIYTGAYGRGDELAWTQVNVASKLGTYPYVGDVEEYGYFLDNQYVKFLLENVPEIYLKQIFKNNYKNVSFDSISLIQALELERLYFKSQGIREYETKILDLSPFSESKDDLNMILDQSEQTTVTKMERRIFDLDINKLKNNVRINDPIIGLYLNFFQHLSLDHLRVSGEYDDIYFNKYIRNYLDWLESELGVDICALGTGAKNNERIIKRSLIMK